MTFFFSLSWNLDISLFYSSDFPFTFDVSAWFQILQHSTAHFNSPFFSLKYLIIYHNSLVVINVNWTNTPSSVIHRTSGHKAWNQWHLLVSREFFFLLLSARSVILRCSREPSPPYRPFTPYLFPNTCFTSYPYDIRALIILSFIIPSI